MFRSILFLSLFLLLSFSTELVKANEIKWISPEQVTEVNYCRWDLNQPSSCFTSVAEYCDYWATTMTNDPKQTSNWYVTGSETHSSGGKCFFRKVRKDGKCCSGTSYTTVAAFNQQVQQCTNTNFSAAVTFGGSSSVNTCLKNYCPQNAPVESIPANASLATENVPYVSGPPESVGNPVNCSSGQKIQSDYIYAGSGADSLSFSTVYTSPKYQESGEVLSEISEQSNGKYRTNNNVRKLEVVYSAGGNKVYRITNKSKIAHYFYGSDANTTPSAQSSKSGTLVINTDGSYTHTLPSGSRFEYEQSGLLTTRTTSNGLTRKYTYEASGKLSTVTNHYGKTLRYSYNNQEQLEKIIDPDLNEYHFEYDSIGNLTKVIYPDETPSDLSDNPTVIYLYENNTYPSHLTGKINEKGIRLATWNYDSNGRAVSSEHAQSLEKVELNYNTNNQTRVTRHISDTLSNDVIYHYEERVIGNAKRKLVTQYEQVACTDCQVGTWSYGYDLNGFISKSTSPSGSVTLFTHDESGFETQRIVAYGTPEQQTIDTVWDTNKKRITKVTKGNLQIEYFYNANNLTSSIVTTDLTTSESRTTSYTYTSEGLLETVDGPRNDVNDLTSYGYDASGNIHTITNALNHVVTLENYDSSGRVGKVTDANGIISTLNYNSRGWLENSTTNGLTTHYVYYPTGSLKKITAPSGQTLEYFYDDGERLTKVQDGAGNKIEYTLDLAGNITKSEVKDPQGIVKFSQNQVFNALGQLSKSLGNNGQSIDIQYDADGSPTSNINALDQTSSFTLDAIKRVTKNVDAIQGETTFTYTDQNRVSTVTDSESRTTSYEYNAYGELTKLTSPDTGVTSYTYDEAGNLKTKTDAKNITVNYSYDALNRLTGKTYPNSSQNVSYAYDDVQNGNKGVGRLASVTESTGSTSYKFNGFGNITKVSRVINGKSYNTEYDFDEYARLSKVVYPSGRTIDYSYNSLGQVEAISTDKLGSSTILASDAKYLPFGPLTNLTLGNSIASNRTYDLDYRLTNKEQVNIRSQQYNYDLVNNIDKKLDGNTQQVIENHQYDNLQRLTSSNSTDTELSYTYDGVGNRKSQTQGSEQTQYTYESNSKLIELAGAYASANRLSVGEWLLDQDGSDTYGQNNGTVQGRISYSENAIKFSTKGGHVNLGNSTDLQLSQGTVEAWIKTPYAGPGFRGIVVKAKAYGIYLYNNQLVIHDWTNSTVAYSNVYLNDNQWHQIVLAFDSGVTNGTKVYIDGNQVISTTYTILNQEEPLGIGAGHENGGAQNYYWGFIDNVRLYNQILTPQDIAELEQSNASNQPVSFTYDANGNTIQKGDLTFTYNDANRMASSAIGGITTTYQYNANGERSVKIRNGVETHFIYGPNGQLIAEADGQGNVTKEYVYFDGQPLAQIVDDNIYYYHNSHLGTPEMMTDTNQNIVWQASYTPFGKATVTNETVVNNIRFPGQYYDGESGLHYNYFRDYDPEIGRYIQSDPIGLNGGINTYAYVGGNPIGYSDRYGLFRGPGGGVTFAPTWTPVHGPRIASSPWMSTRDGLDYTPWWDSPYHLPDTFFVPVTDPRNPISKNAEGEVLSCRADKADKCRDLIGRMWDLIYKHDRRGSKSGPKGMQARLREQLYDPNNLYNTNRNSWIEHNAPIIVMRDKLRKLLETAKGLGCNIPQQILNWSSINPPARPLRR